MPADLNPYPLFLLSPANLSGRRAQILLSAKAQFDLAVRLRATGVSLGEAFSFVSGLYFRGKLAYASAFGRHTQENPGIFVITTNRGLVPPETLITLDDVRSFASIDLAGSGDTFRDALQRDAQRLSTSMTAERCVVLLGSIATGKYADALIDVFGDRLLFPSEFVGRGDMSRGGLMLRQASAGRELTYIPVAGAVRRGKRPPKLG
jgi:hypothetical protein